VSAQRAAVLNAIAEFSPSDPATLERIQAKLRQTFDPVETRRYVHQLIGCGLVHAQTTEVPSPVKRLTIYGLTSDGRAAVMGGAE
jgi:hypothetical protein